MAPSHFGTFDPTAGVIDARGHFLWQHVPENIQYDLPDRDLRVSADGGLVLLHYSTLTPSRGRVERYSEFEVAHRAISLDVDPDLSMPLPNTTGLDIEHWHNSPKPTLNGQVLKLYSHEISRSVAVSSKADVFLLGADWRIRLFDKTGREKWHVNVPAGAFAVNLTGDGRYAVAALEDGSIRWYAVESGHEVMGFSSMRMASGGSFGHQRVFSTVLRPVMRSSVITCIAVRITMVSLSATTS
ncbi:MAG: hypothetical protein JO217_08550 [Acidobacteriaceae bacterium]|nr:hypothetical protein [Acidobacteriaceae bacterium]